MDKDRVERGIREGWYFFIDIVGVSDPIVSIFYQLEKIKKLKDIIENFLNGHYNPEIYKSFTGDGMLIVFLNYEFPIELAIEIHKKIKEHNIIYFKDKERIFTRIGIGFGSYLSFQDGVHKETAPWGHELVLSKRIMDLAHPNQILLTDFAYQKIKNDFLVVEMITVHIYLTKEKLLLKIT
jgi:hypothetical protein